MLSFNNRYFFILNCLDVNVILRVSKSDCNELPKNPLKKGVFCRALRATQI